MSYCTFTVRADLMWSAGFSQTAQCLGRKDIVLSGKIPLITSNLPSLCMRSMIWNESHTARTEFPMSSQWYTPFCTTSTVWERTMLSCYFCSINAHHMQVKHYHTTHKLYDYSQIFDGISVVCVDLHEKYCIGRYFYILPLFYHFSKLHTGQMLL